MVFLARAVGFVKRILKGEDIVLIHQNAEQWNAQFSAGRWDRLVDTQPNTEVLVEWISEVSRERGVPLRVLDVGCGNGGLARRLSALGEKVMYVGTDISEVAIEHARQSAFGTFRVLDAIDPPEDVGVFDVIVFNEVLYYVDPSKTLSRYAERAHNDALVLISVVRSWRTPFVWLRIAFSVRRLRYLSVTSSDARLRWDIVLGSFLHRPLSK